MRSNGARLRRKVVDWWEGYLVQLQSHFLSLFPFKTHTQKKKHSITRESCRAVVVCSFCYDFQRLFMEQDLSLLTQNSIW
jgi:hypothetical protein